MFLHLVFGPCYPVGDILFQVFFYLFCFCVEFESSPFAIYIAFFRCLFPFFVFSCYFKLSCLPLFCLCLRIATSPLLLRLDERSSDTYKGRDFFFIFPKILKICSGSNLLFSGLNFLNFSSFPLLRGRQNLQSNGKILMVTKNVIDQILVSKW